MQSFFSNFKIFCFNQQSKHVYLKFAVSKTLWFKSSPCLWKICIISYKCRDKTRVKDAVSVVFFIASDFLAKRTMLMGKGNLLCELLTFQKITWWFWPASRSFFLLRFVYYWGESDIASRWVCRESSSTKENITKKEQLTHQHRTNIKEQHEYILQSTTFFFTQMLDLLTSDA